jgi:AraC-like DNA-binding protein
MSVMGPITQQNAIGWDGLGSRERVAFWRARHLDGLDGLAAHFTTHRYAPHTHETWVMGAITAGCEVFACRGARHRAAPGQVCVVPPGEVHDGEPVGDGYEYRMLYPSPRLVDGLARELAERPGSCGTPTFAGIVLDDPDLAALFVTAHERLGEAPDDLGGEELLSVAVAALLRRHARQGAPDAASDRPERGGAVARARAVIEARYAEPLSLTELAALAGLTRFRLIRAFKRELGLTPHLYLLDRRVRAAATSLREGRPPAEAAALAGFSDQSHLTRAFKARLGVTPGVFRRGGGGR